MKKLLITFFASFTCYFGMTQLQSNFKVLPNFFNETHQPYQKWDTISNEYGYNEPIKDLKNAYGIEFDSISFKKMDSARSSLAKKIAETVILMWSDSFAVKPGSMARWSCDQGVILRGIEALWNFTGDAKYYSYMQHAMDYYVKDDGSIYDYNSEDFNIDDFNNGKILLTLYQVTAKEKYKKALDQLHNQLLNHPRNTLGGFWHKKSYPNQMWLDDLYMGTAFYAQWAAVFHDTIAYNDITNQFVLVEKMTRDDKTGLLYHAWDERKQQTWADPITGKSPHIWAKAMGWYGLALVDALDYYPSNHPGRATLIEILQRWSAAIIKVQDPKDGVWFDLLDAPTDPRNYKEAAASSMFTLTLFKAIRKGYISPNYFDHAKKAFGGLLANFVVNNEGQFHLKGIVSESGLGGDPYRDGSLDAYFKAPVVENDPKGMGIFLQATVEAEFNQENLQHSADVQHPVVLLDAFYNNEIKKDAYGRDVRWHYAWEEISNGGFGLLGKQFERKGAQLKTLLTAPTASILSKAAVYLIVDPDNYKDNPSPNFMNALDANVISNWVKNGGVLVLLANDSANCDLVHFNQLSEKFGIQFTNESVNMVKGDLFEMGAAYPVESNEVLNFGTKIFVKDVSAIKLTGVASAIAVSKEHIVAAIAKYGKGKVIAIGDPWLYNEYTDGRKLPIDFQNFQAMQQVVNWTLSK